MWAKRIKRMIEKNRDEAQGILLRKYPAFVRNNRVGSSFGIPAFVFHDVTVESLEPMLQFLCDNGYATLTADEYIERQVRGERGQEREVLLTFDDGLKSLYTVAFPVLKRFGLKAVAYVVPGVTSEGDDSRGSDIWERSLCNWKEIGEMHESGRLDIQSHSMYHHSIPISNRVVDFVRPGMNPTFMESDLAPLIEREGTVIKSNELAFGTPLHNWGSRFADVRAFRESPTVVQACVQYVAHHGGADYFRPSGWRRRLKSVITETRRKEFNAGFETEEEQRMAILQDLVNSKCEIEKHLPGKIVRHFCYPWFRGSVLAAELSAEAGYVSNAWGSLLPTFVRDGSPSLPVARLSPHYIWRLPGKGQKSPEEILKKRLFQVARRVSGCSNEN